jgi:hypothetical protein
VAYPFFFPAQRPYGAPGNVTSEGLGGRLNWLAETLKLLDQELHDRVQAVARSAMPSGTVPVVAKRHKAISNFRASATIIFLRVLGAVCVRA